MSNTNSGGVTINDVIMHAGVPNAPFGGVGESGYGSYHGMYGFLAFSHQRIVLELPTWLDAVFGFRYPPYNMKNLSTIAVKNKLGFKPGETMADQKIKSMKGHGWVTKALLAVVLVTGSTVVLKSLSGNKSVVEESRLLWGAILDRTRSLRA
jgi:aldehyde dehydrogenase (NAD+)